MDQYLWAIWAWCKANPITVGCILWVVLNVMPRLPRPDPKSKWAWAWETLERLMILSGDRFFGDFKPLFAPPTDPKG